MENINDILQKIGSLSLEDVFLLQERLFQETEFREQEVFESLEKTLSFCPHCGSPKIIKWCKNKGKQRYMCKECNTTFSATTGTAVHWLKKTDVFLRFSVSMFTDDFGTLKKQAKKFGISPSTAFEWRHKNLIALGKKAPEFHGVTEIDDIWFRYSQKGRKGLKYSRKRGRSSHVGDNDFVSKVLISKERGNELDMSLVKIGRLDKDTILQRLGGKFTETAVLISDKHPSISSFAKAENIKHKSFKAKKHSETKNIHVQTVNNLAERFKYVVNRKLKGVSTKYLQNYTNWFMIMEKYKKTKDKAKEIITLCYSERKTWDLFINIELLYKNFILNKSVRTYRCPTLKYRKHQNWNFENAIAGVYL